MQMLYFNVSLAYSTDDSGVYCGSTIGERTIRYTGQPDDGVEHL